MWHDTGRFNLLVEPGLTIQPGIHAENEDTKRRFANLVAVSSLSEQLESIKPRPATEEELLRFHTEEHLRLLSDLCASGGGLAGLRTPVGPASYEIAKLSAGGVIAAVDAVLSGDVENAYVLGRPPGHHAELDTARGFCLLANGVLGIEHARTMHGISRFAVVDWDVHHGNGQETAYYEDPDVLTISLHQKDLFPKGRGGVRETGAREGIGRNLNVELPPGSGSGAYRQAFERIVIPAIKWHQPQMIFVASGFDAAVYDPLGRMMLSSEDFRYMSSRIVEIADEICGGRIIMHHEGGYSAAYVPYCGLATLEALSGFRTEIDDPFLEGVLGYGGQDLQPHQNAAIDEAERTLLNA